MCSMRNADDSWQDSARELMEDWNLGSEEEPSHRSSSHPAAAMPREFGLDNEPASPEELGAEDSFPVGPTLLYQAFAPMSPRPVGPGSSLRAGGRRSAGAGEELADSSRVGGNGRSGKDGAVTRPTWPRIGDELGGFRLVVELGRGAFARVFLAEEMNLGRRLVALKVSRAEGDEPRILARLQHAHIVPVHSVQDEPATGLRLLMHAIFRRGQPGSTAPGSMGVNSYSGHGAKSDGSARPVQPAPAGCGGARRFAGAGTGPAVAVRCDHCRPRPAQAFQSRSG